jgi:hypothetical protein
LKLDLGWCIPLQKLFERLSKRISHKMNNGHLTVKDIMPQK